MSKIDKLCVFERRVRKEHPFNIASHISADACAHAQEWRVHAYVNSRNELRMLVKLSVYTVFTFVRPAPICNMLSDQRSDYVHLVCRRMAVDTAPHQRHFCFVTSKRSLSTASKHAANDAHAARRAFNGLRLVELHVDAGGTACRRREWGRHQASMAKKSPSSTRAKCLSSTTVPAFTARSS